MPKTPLERRQLTKQRSFDSSNLVGSIKYKHLSCRLQPDAWRMAENSPVCLMKGEPDGKITMNNNELSGTWSRNIVAWQSWKCNLQISTFFTTKNNLIMTVAYLRFCKGGQLIHLGQRNRGAKAVQGSPLLPWESGVQPPKSFRNFVQNPAFWSALGQ